MTANRTNGRARRSFGVVGFAVPLLLALTAGCGGGSDATVLKPSRPTTTFIGPPITAKNPTFHQAVDLDFPGSEIRVLDVSALTSPNVTFLGAVAVWPRDLKKENVGGGPEFPPPGNRGEHPVDQVIPAAETAFVPAGRDAPASVAIAFGFRMNGEGTGAVNGMRIVYEVDGKRKVEVRKIAIVACLPKRCGDRVSQPGFSDSVLRQYGLLPD